LAKPTNLKVEKEWCENFTLPRVHNFDFVGVAVEKLARAGIYGTPAQRSVNDLPTKCSFMVTSCCQVGRHQKHNGIVLKGWLKR